MKTLTIDRSKLNISRFGKPIRSRSLVNKAGKMCFVGHIIYKIGGYSKAFLREAHCCSAIPKFDKIVWQMCEQVNDRIDYFNHSTEKYKKMTTKEQEKRLISLARRAGVEVKFKGKY